MNIQTWKNEAFVVETYGREAVAKLEEELRRLFEEGSRKSRIRWGIRQIVFRKNK